MKSTLGFAVAASFCAEVLAAAPEPWAIECFDAFRRGTFGNAGQNIYVSRAGVLQRIYRFDVDGDGFFDIPFANCQEHHESAPSYVYDAADGARVATLPGQGALCGAVADIDGDGCQDVIVAGHHDMVSPFAAADVYFGGADGKWGERHHIRLQSPRALDCATGRFDATGRPAIVFAMPRWGFVRIYAQSEIGLEWARFRDFETKCDAIAAGDFDGDGFDDLACRDDATGSFSVFWGGADGLDPARFSTTPPVPEGELLGPEQKAGLRSELEEECPPSRLANAVRLGGRTCFTLSTGRKLVFLSARADRTFERVLELDAPLAMAAATGDFDGDGFEDVAIASRAEDRGGTAAPAEVKGEGEEERGGSAAEDRGGTAAPAEVKGPDAERWQTSWIWLGSAAGFVPENRIAVRTRSATDVDALDGMVLFGQCAWDGFYTNDALLYRFEDGALLPEPLRFEGEDTRRARLFRTPGGGVRVALVNHYGRRSDGYDKVYVYRGGEGGYTPTNRIDVPGWCAVDTVIADLDDDARAEMLVCNDSENSFHKDPGLLIHHFGPDGYEPEKSEALRVDIGWGAAVADFDRDGYLDIASVCDHWNALAFFSGGPDGLHRTGTMDLYPLDPARIRHNVAGAGLKRPDAGPLRWIAAADLNGDGWLDLALPTTGAHSLVLWGGPEGFGENRRQEFAAPFCAGVRFADFDNDGRPELIFGGHTRQASGDGATPARQPHHSFLHIYWNGPDGYSESRKCVLRADAASHLCAGDFNGDGLLDIFACSYQGEIDRDIPSFIYWNGPEGFSNTNRQDILTHAASGCIAVDFNEDGRVDLAVANHKVFGDHVGYSEIWWNGEEGFLPTRTTRLPTRGPHSISSMEPGNVLDRGHEEYWVSEPRRVDAAATVDGVEASAELPARTWVTATARAAATAEGLDSAPWRDPAGLAIPEGGYLQIRLALGSVNSLSTPRVTRAVVNFR